MHVREHDGVDVRRAEPAGRKPVFQPLRLRLHEAEGMGDLFGPVAAHGVGVAPGVEQQVVFGRLEEEAEHGQADRAAFPGDDAGGVRFQIAGREDEYFHGKVPFTSYHSTVGGACQDGKIKVLCKCRGPRLENGGSLFF